MVGYEKDKMEKTIYKKDAVRKKPQEERSCLQITMSILISAGRAMTSLWEARGESAIGPGWRNCVLQTM